MRAIFHAFLPNGPMGDPVVWVDVQDQGHSLLLDLGDLRGLPNRKLLRTDHVVVSHTHMDHFVGFDHLLRVVLRREQELVLTGPRGFVSQVESRIGGYTWNLIGDYPVRLRVEEVDDDVVRSALFSGARGLAREPQPDRPFGGIVRSHEAYRVHTAILDHGVPVLAVALREREHLSVDKDRLLREGLRPGAWLGRLKAAVRSGKAPETPVDAESADGTRRTYALGDLESLILRRAPGQDLAYVTDLRHTRDNVERVVALVRGVQLLVCEAPFLHADEALARERSHLTARQAGELARAAGARRLAPFHFSPRYEGREDELMAEAADAFGGTVLKLPKGPTEAESRGNGPDA